MAGLKIGIIGTNFISDRFCEAARSVSGVEVSAVYSRAAQTGEAFASRNGVPKVFTDYGEMLASDIDAVYVASPTFVHKRQSIAAMESGKAVLCEKMMGATLKDVDNMLAVRSSTDAVLLEAMRPDFDPAWQAVKNALPSIGKVRRVHLEFCQYSSRYDRFKSGEVLNAFDPSIANSALADIGIYPLHVCISLFGSPKAVDSHHTYLPGGFEGMGNIILTYDGMLASIVYSKITDGVSSSVIEGELGSIVIDKVSAPKNITLKLRGEDVRQIPFHYSENNMVYEIAAFRDACLGTLPFLDYLDVTRRSVAIVDGVYRSSGISRYFNPDIIDL